MTMTLSELHRRHITRLRGMPAIIDGEGLRIGRQYTMFFAEADLMREHAVRLTAGVSRPDILEVGLGLGVFAQQVRILGARSYTAIEPHHGVVRLAQQRVLGAFDGRAKVFTEPWQSVSLSASAFDAIMYDTWPPEGHADADFASFVEHVAIPCLRPGGRFSFFHSGDTLSPVRREVLDRHFTDWSIYPYTMPTDLMPAHWTKPTRDFLIPIGRKGDA